MNAGPSLLPRAMLQFVQALQIMYSPSAAPMPQLFALATVTNDSSKQDAHASVVVLLLVHCGCADLFSAAVPTTLLYMSMQPHRITACMPPLLAQPFNVLKQRLTAAVYPNMSASTTVLPLGP